MGDHEKRNSMGDFQKRYSLGEFQKRSSLGEFQKRPIGVATRKPSVFDKDVDLDDILVNEVGQLGWYQIRNIIIAAFATISSAFVTEYIFSAATIPYRCRIPECGENTKSHIYDPQWITNAIPYIGNELASCERYIPNTDVSGSLDSCPSSLFNATETVACDGLVYGRINSVVYDFDLGCQEWTRALAGTLNSIGGLLVLPITGYISDQYGRKVALLINIFNMALFGLIRAFSVNYTMYLITQFLQAALGSGLYSAAYIFATEMVGPKYRVLMSAIQSSLFAIGLMIIGAVAWVIQPWRYMIMVLHVPCFLMMVYYWILPESVRWLLTKHRYAEAKTILEKVANLNKTKICDKSMQALIKSSLMTPQKVANKPNLVTSILRSPIMMRRICILPVWWVTTTLVYYGLSIDSTGLSDTMYINYIATCAVEIPGYITAGLVLNKIGRKGTLMSGFLLTAACNIGFIFIPTDMAVHRLVIFLFGKFGISTVMTSLYLYTSELNPTEYRHSIIAFCSMIGRIGLIVAPLTPILDNYWHGTSSALFGGLALISGILVLTQPETLGTKMPDNIEQAEEIGTPESKMVI